MTPVCIPIYSIAQSQNTLHGMYQLVATVKMNLRTVIHCNCTGPLTHNVNVHLLCAFIQSAVCQHQETAESHNHAYRESDSDSHSQFSGCAVEPLLVVGHFWFIQGQYRSIHLPPRRWYQVPPWSGPLRVPAGHLKLVVVACSTTRHGGGDVHLGRGCVGREEYFQALPLAVCSILQLLKLSWSRNVVYGCLHPQTLHMYVYAHKNLHTYNARMTSRVRIFCTFRWKIMRNGSTWEEKLGLPDLHDTLKFYCSFTNQCTTRTT